MGLSNADRQRRYRERKRAEQGKQKPDASRAVTPAVTADAVTPDGPRQPRFLRERGRRLWGDLTVGDPGPAEVVLIEEACRLVDRLDRLDAILGGRDRAWLTLETSDDGTQITVVVDKVLSEARQQQLALKQLLGELRQSSGTGARTGQQRRPTAAETGKGGSVADLSARIAARSGRPAS